MKAPFLCLLLCVSAQAYNWTYWGKASNGQDLFSRYENGYYILESQDGAGGYYAHGEHHWQGKVDSQGYGEVGFVDSSLTYTRLRQLAQYDGASFKVNRIVYLIEARRYSSSLTRDVSSWYR
jgi:hypothetical protein